MKFNPFKKFEQKETNAVNIALDELKRGERIESNISTLNAEITNNPQLFEGREDEIISVLQETGDPNIGSLLNSLQGMKEKRLEIEEGEAREMPAIKVSEGLEELLKAKQNFENIAGDFDELAGFMGAIRQMAGNENYFSDPQFIDRLAKSVDTVTDAVTTWQDAGEKKELEKRLTRLMNTLPASVREQVLEKVA